MTVYGHPREPGEIVDRLLWKDAQLMLSRHTISLDGTACNWCRRPWPCPPRLLAEQAEVAAYEPRNNSWRVDQIEAQDRIPRNRGPYD